MAEGRPAAGRYGRTRMSSPRKMYLFAAVVLALGAIGSIVEGEWAWLAVFATTSAFMYWNSTRVDALIARAEAERAARDRRPRQD